MALQEPKEPDVYQENFEPTVYLEYYKMNQDPTGDEILHFLLKHYNATFKPEIIATDYTDKNLQELEKWLKKMPGAFDWSPVVKYVCELEGNRDKWAEKEERVRRVVSRVLKCDVLKERPLEPAVLPPADGLISSLCPEAACLTLQAFRDALHHLTTLLQPGGHLVLSGTFEGTFYMIGDKRFSALPLSEKLLREALQEAGFIIEKLETVARAAETHLDNRADYTGLFFLVAQRGD